VHESWFFFLNSAINYYTDLRCIDPSILVPGSRWRLLVSFTPWPLKPRGNRPRYPLDMRLGGPQSWSGRCGEEKNPAPAIYLLLSLLLCGLISGSMLHEFHYEFRKSLSVRKGSVLQFNWESVVSANVRLHTHTRQQAYRERVETVNGNHTPTWISTRKSILHYNVRLQFVSTFIYTCIYIVYTHL
jgi:hypothetical protein